MYSAPIVTSPRIASHGRVLFVCGRPDPDPAVAGVATELGYELLRVRSADDAVEHAAGPGFALILAGYTEDVEAFAGVARRLHGAFPLTPLVAERDGDQAAIVVSDNGIGIPADSLESVFQMFTQVSHPNGQSHGGLGIGLSLVRSLVELHGGTVTAATGGIGAGSVFTVRLPLAGKDRPAPPLSARRAPAPPAGLRLLVVDDNRDAADTLAAVLAAMGHTAPVASGGHQALRMIASLRPQLVFLDIGMPGMSGYEVAQAVRADPRFDGVRLVALTG